MNVINLWFLIERSEELPGQWEVHCLELDVISYGNSPQHALAMGIEAAQLVLLNDLAVGFSPWTRRAPQEAWDKLYKLMSAHKKQVPMNQLDKEMSEMRIFAAYPQLAIPVMEVPPAPQAKDVLQGPPSLMAA